MFLGEETGEVSRFALSTHVNSELRDTDIALKHSWLDEMLLWIKYLCAPPTPTPNSYVETLIH